MKEEQLPSSNRMVILVGDVGDNDQKYNISKLTADEAEKFIKFLQLLPRLLKSHSEYFKTKRSTFEDVAEYLVDEIEDSWRNSVMTPDELEICQEILEWEIVPLDIHTIISVDIYGLENDGNPLFTTNPAIDSIINEEKI